jgi:uncharacterized membrane protein
VKLAYLPLLVLAATSGPLSCGGGDPPPDPESLAAAGSLPGDAPASPPPVGWVRAIGTEPFWALIVDDRGLRFLTPVDTAGIRFPPIAPTSAGDTLEWAGETARAQIDARIWPESCSDGMSDRIWSHAATVRIDGVLHAGCAERAPGDSPPDLFGEWTIVDHRIPGIAAMEAEQAIAWHGRSIRFGAEAATSGAVACDDPTYAYRTAPADSLLRGFRIAPSALGLPAPDLRIGLTEVLCGTDRWSALGGTLIWVARGRPYAPWDGVFFELRKAGT